MTNEEFQQIVLKKLETLETGQESLAIGQKNLEDRQKALEDRQKNLETGQKALEDRQKNLETGQEEINEKIDTLIEDLNTVEIVTSKNWNDIAKLKSVK